MVCLKCDSVYEFQDCVYFDSSGQQKPKHCSHVDFPNHPQASMRNPCGGKLLKQVRRKHGNCLVPIKVYSYMSLKESFRMLLNREGFLTCVSNGSNELLHKDFYAIYMWEKCDKCSHQAVFLISFLVLIVLFSASMLTGLNRLKEEFIVWVPFT